MPTTLPDLTAAAADSRLASWVAGPTEDLGVGLPSGAAAPDLCGCGVGGGEPTRAVASRAEHDLPCPVLCDPDDMAYRACGIGHQGVEQVLHDAGPGRWQHPGQLPDARVLTTAARWS